MSLFDSAVPHLVGITPTMVYTAVDSGTLLQCDLSNSHWGSMAVSVWLTRGVQTFYLANGIRVETDVVADVIAGRKIVILQNDEIWMQAPVAGVITALVSAFKDLT